MNGEPKNSRWQQGLQAFDRGDWNAAREFLSDVLLPDSGAGPEHFDALAQATWWLSDVDTTILARERAFRLYQARGDLDAATLVALELTHDHELKHQPAVARAWLNRARDLVAHRPDSTAAGWLARTEARSAFEASVDLESALEKNSEAIRIGRALGDGDLEKLAIHDRGQILTSLGRLAEGRRLMDEAMLAAASGELAPMTVGRIYCNTIALCLDTADYDAAAQWSDEAERWCHSASLDSGYPGICRVKRSEINRRRGLLAAAEAAARRACEELRHFVPFAAAAHAEIGNVHLLRGELDRAEAEFMKAHELGHHAMPGLALIRRARGDAASGAELIRSTLAAVSEAAPARAQLLPAAVELAIEIGDLVAAAAYADELEVLADRFGSSALEASAAYCRGLLALAAGDSADAARLLRKAFTGWVAGNLPHESARARMALGRALLAAGSSEAGRLEVSAARGDFERLGAALDVAEARRLLDAAFPKSDHREDARSLLTEIDHIVVDRYRIVGDYVRFEDTVRNQLADARQRIRAGLETVTHRRENHLIWAAPGSGKSFFVQQAALAVPGVRFIELNLAKIGEEEFREGLRGAIAGPEACLVLVDEVDARPGVAWPYEALLPYLDANTVDDAHTVFAMAGSGGGSIMELRDIIAARPKGTDMLSRIPLQNDLTIGAFEVGDQVLVSLSQMQAIAAKSGRVLRAVEKAALYYLTVTPHLANARQLSEFVASAVNRMPIGEDRLKYDHLFSPGDPDNKEFWANFVSAANLGGRFLTFD